MMTRREHADRPPFGHRHATDPQRVPTNILFADPAVVGLRANDAAGRLGSLGVLANVVGDRVRFVTHRDVSTSDIETAAEAWGRIGDG